MSLRTSLVLFGKSGAKLTWGLVGLCLAPAPLLLAASSPEKSSKAVAVQAALSCLPASHGQHTDLLRTDIPIFSGICFQLYLVSFIYFSPQRGHLQAADSREAEFRSVTESQTGVMLLCETT